MDRLFGFRIPAALLGTAFLIFIHLPPSDSVAECMSGNSVKCFECNSREDFRCNDPFNWTTLPPVEDCTGCCVKMVQDIGTENEVIRRTCTNYIEINLFIVDHVCMKEKRGKGKACYCESNECNGGNDSRNDLPIIGTLSAALITITNFYSYRVT